MSEMHVDRKLAEEWWRDHRPGGVYFGPYSPGADMDTPEWDRAYEVDLFVERCIRDVTVLPRVLRLFAETAQSDRELAYVGTWHLENAYFSGLGEGALDALRASGLDDTVQASVLAGFRL